ncbi:hypothetical protein C8R43DRAFT_1062329 [Mycena crocata]|nr:hypothetical protein C8R43DRAFT_1062329 [Mycena crocata]
MPHTQTSPARVHRESLKLGSPGVDSIADATPTRTTDLSRTMPWFDEPITEAQVLHHQLVAIADATWTPAMGIQTKTPTRSGGTSFSSTTPQSRTFHDSEGAYQKIRDIQAAVREELRDAWVEEDGELLFQQSLKAKVEAAYPLLKEKAKDWLEKYDGYDASTSRWKNIPNKEERASTKKPLTEKELYEPLTQLMTDIMKEFETQREHPSQHKAGQPEKTRKVTTTFKGPLAHNPEDAQDDDALKSAPDICIFGTGPSATMRSKISSVHSYDQVATVIEVKLAETWAEIVKDQMAVYGREVLIAQPQRRFVYTPLMTGETIRVIQFDRSGAEYTKTIDYHKDPIFFIQLVVLFSSLDEELLGYDTSIYWENGKRMLAMVPDEIWVEDAQPPRWEKNVEKKVLVFEILNANDEATKDAGPLFARRTIRSRGTVCWRARCEDKVYLIKDYWGVVSRTPESDFLKDVSGIDGIGQMYAFANNRATTYGLRTSESELFSTTTKLVPNRSLTRLALRMYKQTLETAKSALQLLCAIRDIVKGHRDALLERDILHRDISFNNLLLSSSTNTNATGILIDFDMAKKMQQILASHVTTGDSRTGTRFFQSVRTLQQIGHHDHMDDLESIFYVMFFVCYAFDHNGNPLEIPPNDVREWEKPELTPPGLANMKRGFLTGRIASSVSRFVGAEKTIVRNLMEDLRKFFAPRLEAITDASMADESERTPMPDWTAEAARRDYTRFLFHIDSAIVKLEALPPPPPPISPLLPFRLGPSPKRRLPDDAGSTDNHPPPKRSTRSRNGSAGASTKVVLAGDPERDPFLSSSESESGDDYDPAKPNAAKGKRNAVVKAKRSGNGKR